MFDNNGFIKLEESANGRVSVKLQKNQFAEAGTENYYGKVNRFTYSPQNILSEMSKNLPFVDTGTVTSVMNAYTNTLLSVLAAGNAVKFGELGTFYIAGKGSVEGENEKPALTVKFSASQTLKDAVKDVEITSSVISVPSGTITSITSVATGKKEEAFTSGCAVLVEGSSLKVGGEGSGIWLASITENGAVTTDESSWLKVESALTFNLPSKLLFTLPADIQAGTYKLVVRTRYAEKSSYERKYTIEISSDAFVIS